MDDSNRLNSWKFKNKKYKIFELAEFYDTLTETPTFKKCWLPK